MNCICVFVACPLPTIDFFISLELSSVIGIFSRAIAVNEAPRAWPRANVDFGLSLTNTFSITAYSGVYFEIISRIPTKISRNLSACVLLSVVLTIPLEM